MKWLKSLLSKFSKKKSPDWDALNYGKPSTEGDDFRRMNDV